MSKINCCFEHGIVKEDGINLIIEKFNLPHAYAFATYTDRYECTTAGVISDTSHLLEIRIFNQNSELKISRSAMGGDFKWRIIDDDKFKASLKGSDDIFDTFEKRTLAETQYLDIDSKKSASNDCTYITTGGGKYTLPIPNAEKILIQNYIDYDDQGIANICDFRIVKFLQRGED